MIRLQHAILIEATPERLWRWLADLPTHYREWHPAHVSCRYERGSTPAVGAVLYAEEYLHGRMHRLRLTLTEVVSGHVIRYRGAAVTGCFLLEPANGGTRFGAELAIGLRAPVVGGLIDAVVRRCLRHRLAAIEAHMREEGENLKRIIEHEPHASQQAGETRRTSGAS